MEKLKAAGKEKSATYRQYFGNRMGETEWYFAIVLKDTGKVIGEIDAYPETPEPHDQDGGPPLDTFSPCWMLNKAYHGRGYAYEAAHALYPL